MICADHISCLEPTARLVQYLEHCVALEYMKISVIIGTFFRKVPFKDKFRAGGEKCENGFAILENFF